MCGFGASVAWRIRVSDYRIGCEIHDRVLLVVVIGHGHRHDSYRVHEVAPATATVPLRTAP